MLLSIDIQNFRSCDDVQLRLEDPVIVLLGKNGAGKTNILHAVRLASELCLGEPESVLELHPNDRTKPSTFVLRFRLCGHDYQFRISRMALKKGEPFLEESLDRDGKSIFTRNGEHLATPLTSFPRLTVSTQVGSLSALTQFIPPQEQLQIELLRPIAEYLRTIRYYPLPQQFQEHTERPPTIIDLSNYEKWAAALDAGRPGDSVTCRLVHMHLKDRDKLDELRKLIGEEGLGLVAEIRVDEIRTPGRKTNINPELAYAISFFPCLGIAGAGRPFRYNELSAGTWRVLRLLTYLVFDASSCMLVEQPEDSIHAGLLDKVIDILCTYSDRTQLICTTHSPQVMNLVQPKAIRIVRAESGSTRISELSPNEMKASQTYLEDEGTLAEFLETL